MSTHPPEQPQPARERLLLLLKTRGPQTTAELRAALDITGEATRQQLVRLEADGLVAATATPHGVGRPAQVWTLTEQGHARFPDAHAELTAQLLRTIQTELGPEALDRLIAARANEARTAYTAELAGANNLGERVARLAEARSREGYMAEARPEGGGFVLVENHCPICVAATACQGYCRAERDVFEQVLGDATVERTEHIVSGDRRCAYRITPREVPAADPKSQRRRKS